MKLIIGLSILIILLISILIFFDSRKCKSGHYEKQIEVPTGIVLNGISIPVGNAYETDVFICDIYE